MAPCGRYRWISIHAPQWGATGVQGDVQASVRVISIHAPQWGATALPNRSASLFQFQSTHPSGVRRHQLQRQRAGFGHFNPRTPVGCDIDGSPDCTPNGVFQSTHPSGVRLLDGLRAGDVPEISIHAPQWGATRQTRRRHRLAQPISIHAPQWGATRRSAARTSRTLFQSTHPSGVRRFEPMRRVLNRLISIHAPQWGATVFGHDVFPFKINFNPRTPVGCDTTSNFNVYYKPKFQSTHPSGVRLSTLTCCCLTI